MLQDKVQGKCRNLAYRLIRSYAMSSGSFCNICNIMAHLTLMLVVLCAIPVYAAEDRLSGDRAVEPWNIAADEMCYDQ